jgi:hypothetical protein
MSHKQCTTDIPVIPREVLFGNPDKTSPRLSHDRKQLAFLAPLAGVLNVWVGSAEGSGKAPSATFSATGRRAARRRPQSTRGARRLALPGYCFFEMRTRCSGPVTPKRLQLRTRNSTTSR